MPFCFKKYKNLPKNYSYVISWLDAKKKNWSYFDDMIGKSKPEEKHIVTLCILFKRLQK